MPLSRNGGAKVQPFFGLDKFSVLFFTILWARRRILCRVVSIARVKAAQKGLKNKRNLGVVA